MRRKTAGSFLRSKMHKTTRQGVGAVGLSTGLTIGLILHILFPRWISFSGIVVVYIVLLLAVFLLIIFITRKSSKWRFENSVKGEDAETWVGQTIEYSITSANCAVAHSVTEIAKVGDIDHLLATPIAVWVIETKYKKVPKKNFPEVLRRIAENTSAVRQWAPAGTTVRGCLVLAYEKRLSKRIYSHRKEQISAYTPDRLQREIEREVRAARLIDEDVANAVWELGKIVE